MPFIINSKILQAQTLKILNRYALPYAAPHVAYAHAPVVYNALESGLVYPLAEPYVHDATGDMCLEAGTCRNSSSPKNETSFLEDVVVVKKIFVMVVENDDQVCDNFEG